MSQRGQCYPTALHTEKAVEKKSVKKPKDHSLEVHRIPGQVPPWLAWEELVLVLSQWNPARVEMRAVAVGVREK